MRLLILKNSNAINIEKIKQITIEGSKICADINGGGVSVCIYNQDLSFEYKKFKKRWQWTDDDEFLFTVVKRLYSNLDDFKFNVDIRSIEQWALADIEEKVKWGNEDES